MTPQPSVRFAHGFSQTGASWRGLVELVRAHWTQRGGPPPLVCPDMLGHGAASNARGDLWAAADHLLSDHLFSDHLFSDHLLPVDGSEAEERDPVRVDGTSDIVGYSMGGRIALHAALAHPHLVNRLVLIGATAGLDSDAERAERRRADAALADRVLEIGLEEFLAQWLAGPLFAHLTPEQQDLSSRRLNTAEGLAASLRTCGTGTQQPLWNRLHEIRCPTLVLVGEDDSKFTAIGERLVAGLPNAELQIVPEAGHAVHTEQPAVVAALLVDFLAG